MDGLLESLGEEVLSGELGGIALAELVEEVGGVFGVVGAFPRAGVGDQYPTLVVGIFQHDGARARE